ncbi:MAG: retroviral-like aspartic protease family protein [Planctomycetota bacterium]
MARLHLTEPVVVELVPNRLPVVLVSFDGGPPVPCLVDCGAEKSFLDADAAERLGVKLGDYAQPFTVRGVDGHESRVHRCAYVRRVELGALLVEDCYIPLLESDLFDVQNVGGLLGQDVLARFPFVIDVQRGKLHLLPPDMRRTGIETYLGAADIGRGDWVIATADFRPCPFLTLDVEGVGELEIEVDTGAGMMCLPERVIDALALTPVGVGEAPSLAGPKQVRTYLLENFGLFGTRIRTEVQAIRDEHGLLGMDVLGGFVLVLNAPEKTVWLHRRTTR